MEKVSNIFDKMNSIGDSIGIGQDFIFDPQNSNKLYTLVTLGSDCYVSFLDSESHHVLAGWIKVNNPYSLTVSEVKRLGEIFRFDFEKAIHPFNKLLCCGKTLSEIYEKEVDPIQVGDLFLRQDVFYQILKKHINCHDKHVFRTTINQNRAKTCQSNKNKIMRVRNVNNIKIQEFKELFDGKTDNVYRVTFDEMVEYLREKLEK